MLKLLDNRKTRFMVWMGFLFGASALSFASNNAWLILTGFVIVISEIMGVKEWWRV